MRAIAYSDKPKIASRTARMGKLKKYLPFYLFISPWFIVFLALGLIPLLWGLYLSFTNYDGFNFNNVQWIGMANYVQVFQGQAMPAMERTVLITLINVPLGTVIGFMLAVLLNTKVKGVAIYRTIFYLPSVFPVVATGLMWSAIYADQGGMLNEFLGFFGVKPINWLGYTWAPTSLIFMLLWGSGGALLIYLAGLKGVPQSLYESAAIDGATSAQRFFNVTVPLMTPVIFFNLVLGIIGSLQILLQPIILSGGGLTTAPIMPIYLYMVDAWLQIFSLGRFSYGLAMLWVLFVIVLLLTLVVFATSKYWVYYEAPGE